MKTQIIQQGAEAIITLSREGGRELVIKNRIKKSYRLPELDEKLRKLRTRSEAKIIDKLNSIIPVPELIETDEKNKLIIMEYIDGLKLSDNLESLDWKIICKKIGEIITNLHNQDIIHGDLTTSNMIYVENDINRTGKTSCLDNSLINNAEQDGEGKLKDSKKEQSSEKHLSKSKINKNSQGKVFLIDFGLSFHSHKLEDKAVDLHLLKQALEAKHFKIAEPAITIILKNYKPRRHKEILEQLKKVESRGRYKEKY